MNVFPIDDAVHPIQIPKIVLSKESSDLLKRLKTINEGYFFKPNCVLLKMLKDV